MTHAKETQDGSSYMLPRQNRTRWVRRRASSFRFPFILTFFIPIQLLLRSQRSEIQHGAKFASRAAFAAHLRATEHRPMTNTLASVICTARQRASA